MAGPLSKPARLFLLNLWISFLVALFILLLTQDILLEFPPLKRAELSLIDRRFQARGPISTVRTSSNIVIVEISQESFRNLPEKWPWPRSYYTHLIRNLKRAGARAIGLDIIFSSSDPRNPANDEEFRRALQDAGNVVLAGSIESEAGHGLLQQHEQQYGNIFIDSTARYGLVNAREDEDGVLRRYVPFYYDAGRNARVPAFSFAVLNAWFDRPPLATADLRAKSFSYKDRIIPRYDATSFLINYYGPSNTFRRVNFSDVLDDKDFQTVDERNNPGEQTNTFDDPETGYFYDGTFKDKIVLIGSTLPEDKDLFSVSIAQGRQAGDNKMFGVEMHANVIQEVLDADFIIREPFWMTAAVVFGLSLFTFVLTAGLKAIRTKYSALIELLGFALVLAELFIIYWASLKLFIDKNFLADMTSPFLAVIISYVGSTVYNYVTERKQKVLIKSMFSRYVNPAVVDELVAHPEKLRLGGERKELTVFFSDIEEFTRISERMPPEDLVAVLNEYLSVMTSIILANNGTLDKYEGDAIVAFWGAPIWQPDHALRACRTAIQMQESLAAMSKLWQQEGKPVLNTRIGINTGEMIIGNMGGAHHFDYTVIGDSVNLGARLETANKQYKTNTMISESTYRRIEGRMVARELDMIVVAGKSKPIRVYELVASSEKELPSKTAQFLELYNIGLTFYRQREWESAIETFGKALQLVPGDHTSSLYLERSRLYRTAPPPIEWDGVFVLESK